MTTAHDSQQASPPGTSNTPVTTFKLGDGVTLPDGRLGTVTDTGISGGRVKVRASYHGEHLEYWHQSDELSLTAPLPPIYRPEPAAEPVLDETQELPAVDDEPDPVGALESHRLVLPSVEAMQFELLEEVLGENKSLTEEIAKLRATTHMQSLMLQEVVEEYNAPPPHTEIQFFSGIFAHPETARELQKLLDAQWNIAYESIQPLDASMRYYARLEREVPIAVAVEPEAAAAVGVVENPTREQAARIILSAQEIPAVAAEIAHAAASMPSWLRS